MKGVNFSFLRFNLISGCIGSSLLHVGFLQLRRAGATLHCGAWASHCGGFSCCGARALGARASVVVARGLQSAGSVVVATGLVAPRHVGSSWTGARTRVPCIGRRILIHCATREVSKGVNFYLIKKYTETSKMKKTPIFGFWI